MKKIQKKPTIMLVDDVPENIAVLSEVLQPEYKVRAATHGRRALEIATRPPLPDLILLDIALPEIDGYAICRLLKENPKTSHIPIIFVTAHVHPDDEAKGLELGAVDYITKPIRPAIVRQRVKTHLTLYQHQKMLEQEVQRRTQELQTSRLHVIQRLGKAAEFRDNETGLHVVRMSHYAQALAYSYTSDATWSELILNAAPMHDVGKIGIPDKILLKPGKLDSDEWETMKTHPQIGADIIGEPESELLLTAREIALTHHERWNGSGYPHGLAAEDIPLVGRVVAVADVFDALTTQRPYKRAWAVKDAVELIERDSGSHFDPTLVQHFLKILPQILTLREKYREPEGGQDLQAPH